VLSTEGKIVLIMLMLIGGTAFSTAGGIKAGRILQIFLRLTKRNFATDNAIRSISSVSSRYNESYVSYGKKTEELRAKKAFRESLAVVILFLLLSFITATVLFYLEQRSFMDSLFESVSALTTTGLSSGVTSMDMDVVSKVFLIVNMILGRFEIIAVIYIFIENRKIPAWGSGYLKHLHIHNNKHQDKPAK